MLGFLSWFNGKTKIKRWIFVILIGIVCTCFAFTFVIETNILTPADILKVVGLFALGFSIIIIGIIFIQRRTMEIIVEANNVHSGKGHIANLNMQSLIFNRTVYNEGPKVVVIGGGTGLNTVITGLKKYTNNITAIVTLSDYGKIDTESRRQLDTLPFDDITESIVSLSDKEELMSRLMNWKFKNKKLQDIKFGDVFLVAINEMFDNLSEGIQKSTEVLNITGKVLPSTLDEITICAELQDGTTVQNKQRIPEVAYNKVASIDRIYISPSNCRPAPGVLEAIQEADAIIIGPGSLYTNVLPNLLVKNVSKTIKESKALKIYVTNIMTEPGQTDNYSISDHLEAIFEHVGREVIDYCLADTGEIIPEYIRKYNLEGADVVDQDIDKVTKKGIKIIQKPLAKITGNYIRHDPDSIAATVMELICNDLKFRDKQATPQYMFLNSILGDERKTEKKRIKSVKDDKRKREKAKEETRNRIRKNKNRRPSKFNTKYKDRIEAIQFTEMKKDENMKLYKEMEKREENNKH
ncbi:MAG: uridine diphosphate-N-acetylglucosamine-binding protein YvcK [Clostridia bacterium]|nr:uridine diphosphate-N-acetylglucosamine-binding protein YvcK [Clostridia bacterium]